MAKAHESRDAPRICLIVDHPDRDLDGMVLLGTRLVNRGAEVFLVPMYQQSEILFLRPDFVLLPHIRPVNEAFAKSCRATGIAIGVLDTEGASHRRPDMFAEMVAGYLSLIDVYFLWGARQYASITAQQPSHTDRLIVTGCPRFDYLAPRWRPAIPDLAEQFEDLVLVNTNFPIIRPRFLKIAGERKILVDEMGLEPDYVSEMSRQCELALKELVAGVVKLARAMPGSTFVVRPHPFEDRGHLDLAFAGLANVQVRQEGPVHPWLKACRVLVHHNCTTAVEAVMLNKKAIMPDWFDAPLLALPECAGVSSAARSEEDINELVAASASDGRESSSRRSPAHEELIEAWFHTQDGGAADRVADAIMAAMSSTVSSGRRASKRYRAYREILRPFDVMRFAKGLFTWIAGYDAFYRLKSGLTGSNHSNSKQFAATDVRAVMTRIARVDPCCGVIDMRPAVRRDAMVAGNLRLYSTRLAPAGALVAAEES